MTEEPLNDNDELEAITDRAMEAMQIELDHWKIIGPTAQDTYLAVRDPIPAMIFADHSAAVDMATSAAKNFHMKDKAHAVLCLQWHGLRAAIAAVKEELALLGSNNDGTLTTAELSPSTPSEEGNEE